MESMTAATGRCRGRCACGCGHGTGVESFQTTRVQSMKTENSCMHTVIFIAETGWRLYIKNVCMISTFASIMLDPTIKFDISGQRFISAIFSGHTQQVSWGLTPHNTRYILYIIRRKGTDNTSTVDNSGPVLTMDICQKFTRINLFTLLTFEKVKKWDYHQKLQTCSEIKMMHCSCWYT